MATFPEAEKRLYGGVYVCRKCEKKGRFPVSKVLAGKVKCKGCGYKVLRPVRKRAKK